MKYNKYIINSYMYIVLYKSCMHKILSYPGILCSVCGNI